MKEWMNHEGCDEWCMMFWDYFWTTNTLVHIKKSLSGVNMSWQRMSVWCVRGKLGGVTVMPVWLNEWCGKWSSVFLFLCETEKKSVSVQYQCGSRDSPSSPRLRALKGMMGIHSDPTPTPPPLVDLQNEWEWLFWCLVQLLNVQCVRWLVLWTGYEKSSFLVHCISCVLRNKTQKL